MVRKIENFVLLIAFVAALLTVVNSSSSSPKQNDILEELKADLKSLRFKVDLLESRNVENEVTILKQGEKIIKLEQKMTAASLIDERAFHSVHREESNLEGQDSDNNYLKLALKELNDSTENNAGQRSYKTYEDSLTRAIAPSSCRDLSMIGHSLDGLYLVQNVDTNKIETVLCNFGTSDSQQLVIGGVDVKTKTVHFYVQRETTFSSTGNAVIPWELARLNEGGAMNLANGIFTAPVDGIYHFEFSGLKAETANYLWVTLQLNGADIGSAGTSNVNNTGTYEGFSLTASLRLRAGDRVNMYNWADSVLFENLSKKTHFTGWLVEQDLSPIAYNEQS